mgnify:CR=1 FL=1
MRKKEISMIILANKKEEPSTSICLRWRWPTECVVGISR